MDGGERGFSLMLTTPDAVEQAFEYYKKAMAEQGWTSDQSLNMSGQHMLMYQKDDRRLHVMIAKGDAEETMISLTGGAAE